MKTKELEIDISPKIIAADREKKTLNKPFRTPDGPKKFSVYVKNEKGNVVKVNFGDPNMEIKRDDPARRKSFRARHGCDKNPGPKWKARYWSCYQWRAGAPVKASEENPTLETEAGKGLWYNIQKKKQRLGKDYKPAKPGDKDYPKQDALKKAQANEDEWDGVTFWDQAELLKIWPELSKADDIAVEDDAEEMMYHTQDAAEMAVGQFSLCVEKLQDLIVKIQTDPEIALEISEPWIINKIAITEHNINAIHTYLVYPKGGFLKNGEAENGESEDDSEDPSEDAGEGPESVEANYMNPMFMVGQKVKNINKSCYHYGSEGIIKEIKDLPDKMGKVISYEVTNEGPTFKKGDVLTKTIDQLSRAQVYASYEQEEEYKSMCETEGQNFKDFLQKCIPSKEGSDKEKFQSCLLDYKKNK